MKQPINEIKRMQQLAGILNENQSNEIEDFLINELLPTYEEGNDINYEPGKPYEYNFEYDEYTWDEGYDDEFINGFKKASKYLQNNHVSLTSPDSLVTYKFSSEPNGDILINWIEPI